MNAARNVALALLAIAGHMAPSLVHADDSEAASVADALRAGLAPSAVVVEVSMGMAASIVEQGQGVIASDGSPLGVAAAFTAGVRTAYFVTPMIDMAYYGLGGSTDTVMTAAGETIISNRLELITLSFGLLIDLSHFRLRVGMGAFEMALDSRTLGVAAESARWNLGYLLGITGHFYRHEGRQIGIEGRLAVDAGSDIVVLTLGLAFTLDVFELGGYSAHARRSSP
jgi:hypothetical protein